VLAFKAKETRRAPHAKILMPIEAPISTGFSTANRTRDGFGRWAQLLPSALVWDAIFDRGEKLMLRQIAYRLMKNKTATRVMVGALCRRYGCSLRTDGDTILLRSENRQIRLAAKHLIFCPGTAEHFDTYFSAVQPSDVNGFSEVDYSKPKLHRLSNGLEFEIPSMPEEAESAEAYFHHYKPKSGDLVFDIGAYCGTFTRELSLAVGPTGRVIAFEPDSLNFELLQRNIVRHGLANVVTFKAAVFYKNWMATIK
jgi:hypothetical protein